MLTRRREPEVMDSAQDAQEYDAMDHREVNQQFAQDLLAGGNLVGEVLDLGVGTAQIPIEICQQCSSCKILGIDLADSMLQLGRRRVVSVGMTDRVSLERQDAKQLKYPANRFDAVISNSIVHHIPRPDLVFEEALRVVKQDGFLFFRDLMRPATKTELNQLVKQYVGNEARHARQLFEESLWAALTVEEVRKIVVDLGFTGETVQATSDRHWTWIGRLPLERTP